MIDLETWTSTDNQEERHYFLRNGQQHVYQGQYLFGYNPKLVSEATVMKIMALVEEGME